MSTGMMLPIAEEPRRRRLPRDRAARPVRISRRPCANCARTRGSASAGSPSCPEYAAAADCRAGEHVRLRPAVHVRALHRAHGRERHPAGAHLRAVERSARLELPGEVARKFGLDPIVNLIYSVSPVHTDEYYAERCRQAVTLQAVPALPQGSRRPAHARAHAHAGAGRARELPAASRSSCTAIAPPGSARWSRSKRCKLGIRIVNTGVPPLADGSALPSIYNVAHNLRALGYKPVIDENVLRPVTEHFNIIARREGFPIGVPAEYDYEDLSASGAGRHDLQSRPPAPPGRQGEPACRRRWKRPAACGSSSAIRSW